MGIRRSHEGFRIHTYSKKNALRENENVKTSTTYEIDTLSIAFERENKSKTLMHLLINY
jgi:hypothetical protein